MNVDAQWPANVIIDGVRVPRFLYGTAWKEEATERLTELAIATGFRGIDTANQRRHYHEAGVGAAIVKAIQAGQVTRADLFLQTKFTFRRGQDHRLPYDADAPVPLQVEQSLASSLEHLGTDWIDSFVLHGPSGSVGLAAADWAAWQAMEKMHDEGQAKLLGVSNASLDQLRSLCQQARVKPRFVQNRCYAARGWDRQVRAFCASAGILYQGFSLLTANRAVLASGAVAQIAQRHGWTSSQTAFRFALDVGMIALTGTSSAAHMREDLAVLDQQLESDEIALLETLANADGSLR